MVKLGVLLGFGLLLLVSGTAWAQEAQKIAAQKIEAPEIAALRNLLDQDCGSCHGLTRKGGLGAPLTPERMRLVPVAALARVILDGLPGTAMPPWRGLITPAQAERLAEMLQQPPPATSPAHAGRGSTNGPANGEGHEPTR